MSYVATLHLYRIELGAKLIRSLRLLQLGQFAWLLHGGGGYKESWCKKGEYNAQLSPKSELCGFKWANTHNKCVHDCTPGFCLATLGGGGWLIQGPTHPEFWHTHRPTNVPPPPPGGGGGSDTHPPTHPPTYPTETCNTEDQVFHRGEQDTGTVGF